MTDYGASTSHGSGSGGSTKRKIASLTTKEDTVGPMHRIKHESQELTDFTKRKKNQKRKTDYCYYFTEKEDNLLPMYL